MRRGSLSIAVSVAFIALMPLVASAAEVRVGAQAIVGSSEELPQNTYMAGGNVVENGVVKGELVTVGGTVLIAGPIWQDLIAAGGTVDVQGSVGGNVRIGGGNIVINNKVNGDVLAGGGTITISGSGVGGDLIAGGGETTIDAPIGGNVRVAGSSLTIDAPVNGTVYFEGNKLTLGDNAAIKGDLIYSAPQQVIVDQGATVAGTTTYTQTAAASSAAEFFSVYVLARFLIMLVCALVLLFVLRRYVRDVVADAVARPGSNFGIGSVSFIVLPVVSLILLATILGIPFGLIGLFAFGALAVLATLLAAIILGAFVLGYFKSPRAYEATLLSTLVGAVLMTLIGLIPLLGWIVDLVFILLAFGAMMRIKWRIVKEWR